ncbi:putrescine hydroxycinnamoyltransferase 3-like [Rhodamnia argentea]|uniref:Putrescine hydroxycinnamoyltransferase 3-like n=1 Tax=Rhodamnia argentea TaxID=178133 RepID=A0A8B8NF38_9MYRT|nr:putrescine hydroxycinnamoyltransferase 3-like [Rhodamnia argentea]
MKVKIESSRIIKPCYDGPPPSTTTCIPLSPFDNTNYDGQIAVIYAYRPPTPPNLTVKLGLQKVLSAYREWAGRLGKNEEGDPVIVLNDKGVRFVEASVDDPVDESMPSKPSPVLLTLHPPLKGVEELVQVQLTRFSCGSLVVGFSAHHRVADGHATSNFLVAWGKACRGLEMGPLPTHDRTIFVPRDPPKSDFQHKGAEYTSKKPNESDDDFDDSILAEEVVIDKVHFTTDFLAKLKSSASLSLNEDIRSIARSNGPTQPNKMYTTFECLVAHLWRGITRARALSGSETTQVRIAVDGRMRLNPRVPNNYFGNLVLWAFPEAKVKDLLNEPTSYATKVIHEAVSKVDDRYFKSFIDFASHALKGEDLHPTQNINPSPADLEVDSWLRFPFYDLDFGCGSPYLFMPFYFPTEGIILLSPSFKGDGSIDAFIPLHKDHLERFKDSCYTL